jgi:hypothetical protein
MAVPVENAEEVLPGQRDGNVQTGFEPRRGDSLAPARGVMVGLASSTVLWIAALLAWCL